MVAQSADVAVANANMYRTCQVGRCLQYVRTWLVIPAAEPSATAAWASALGKHPGDMKPPRGAPAFFTGGSRGYGHIELTKNPDNALLRGTDYPAAGLVGDQTLGWYISHWTSLKYVGWAEGFNGVWIPWLQNPSKEPWQASGAVYVAKLHQGQQDSDSVQRLRYRLSNHAKMPENFKPGLGGGYGKKVIKAVKYWIDHIDSQHGAGGPGDGSQVNNGPAKRLFGDAYSLILE